MAPQNQKHNDDIHVLLGLITSAAEDAANFWERETGRIPSLDDPETDSTRASAPELLRAVRLLEGAYHQLCSILAPTFVSLLTRAWAPLEDSCLRVALQAKIPDVLEDTPQGLHVNKVAKQVGLPADKLARVLRLLAQKHCFREVSKDVFANNRLSYALRSSAPLTALIVSFENLCTPQAWGKLYEALKDPVHGPSDAPDKCSFMYAIGETFFGYLAERVIYPIDLLPAGATWCDIGGGVGGVLIPVARAHSRLQLTLQDQPHVIEEAKRHWALECPSALKENRISFVPIDFFKDSPVPGQDVYYMRMIIHDWPDAACIVILTNISRAMKPESRLLVHDYVLTSPVPNAKGARDSETVKEAPKPLLPNYGAGGARPFCMDVNMMSLLNAKERTLDDFVQLGLKAGLEFVKFWDGVEMSVVEFKKA
ncbi:S-adenosyl-L-methionine-dependent methyltransferase [Dentipellis sp. KUC8613]|nr:S-adenosyl-L-methionine-dependent methyltransferase [Dentipellis sp. KUC8613]